MNKEMKMNKEITKLLTEVVKISKKYDKEISEFEVKKDSLLEQLEKYGDIKNPKILKLNKVVKSKIEVIEGEIELLNINKNDEIKALNFDELVDKLKRSYEGYIDNTNKIRDNYLKEIREYNKNKIIEYYDNTLPEREEFDKPLKEINKIINNNSTLEVFYDYRYVTVPTLYGGISNDVWDIENEFFDTLRKERTRK